MFSYGFGLFPIFPRTSAVAEFLISAYLPIMSHAQSHTRLWPGGVSQVCFVPTCEAEDGSDRRCRRLHRNAFQVRSNVRRGCRLGDSALRIDLWPLLRPLGVPCPGQALVLPMFLPRCARKPSHPIGSTTRCVEERCRPQSGWHLRPRSRASALRGGRFQGRRMSCDRDGHRPVPTEPAAAPRQRPDREHRSNIPPLNAALACSARRAAYGTRCRWRRESA
jgi:hypothetical protein